MKFWIASLLLALAGAAQADDTARFTAEVEGSLTIGPEGQVVDVQLRDAAWMGEAVVEGYLQTIRGWRFEPIVEDGKAVNATGEMRLRLAALRNDTDKTAHFAIEEAGWTKKACPGTWQWTTCTSPAATREATTGASPASSPRPPRPRPVAGVSRARTRAAWCESR